MIDWRDSYGSPAAADGGSFKAALNYWGSKSKGGGAGGRWRWSGRH